MKPSQLEEILPKLLKGSRVPFIWGDPGIGKTSIVANVADKLEIGLITIILALYDPTDIRGFPCVVGTGKNAVMRFIRPEMLPSKGKGILLADEVPQASLSMQSVMYQLILEGRIGEYVMPDGWRIVAAGNYAHNGGMHNAMPPALANRFIHIDMECSQSDWDAWAADNDITDLTRGFLRFRPGLIHDMQTAKTSKAFPTPRSWEFADEIIREDYSLLQQMELLKGTIGEGPMREYLEYIRSAKELPSIQEILMSPKTAPVPTSPGAKHAVMLLIERNATPVNMKQCMEYAERFTTEYQTALMNSVARNKRELCDTKEYVDWAIKNKAVMGFV